MRIQLPHCPACGAPLEVPEAATRVACAYCRATLVIDGSRVSGHRSLERATPQAVEPFPEPDVTLSTWQAPRFELSFLDQPFADAPPQVFVGVELDDRFALIWLRVIDAEGEARRDVPLDDAFAALRASLERDRDPGLAANVALEALCRRPFEHRLECAIALFEPRRMRVVTYVAGCPQSVAWASSEEGRTLVRSSRHDALERKMLREAHDHFSNDEPIYLSAHDVIVFASAGYLHRGGRGYGEGARVLVETLNAQLGEAPLRVVTLAKNAFWDNYQLQHARKNVGPPVGPIQVAAVRAVLPPHGEGLPSGYSVTVARTKHFELAALTQPTEQHRLLPLHGERAVFVWASSPDAVAFDAACAAVVGVLDRPNHGDNENPREAGRAAVAVLPPGTRVTVIQVFERHHRVKYFTHGWRPPLTLGPRGVKSDSQQQFDSGGEATVQVGHRLFFTGALAVDRDHLHAPSFAEEWNGGKASRLYEAMREHWKTRRTGPALEALARAVIADAPHGALAGLALVTGVEVE
jgi:LSD1 subclass zinc finger protein